MIIPIPLIIHGVPVTGSSLVDAFGELSIRLYDLLAGLGSSMGVLSSI